MTIKVSVVVPVYNAAAFIDRAVETVATQSMAADEIELICVDDGSTDGSLARLRELEVAHPQLRVISIPASGWPGKPRNVGTAAATGEYVLYLDQDDLLDPEALQRMYDLGSAHAADIVLGKVTSDFRGVHQYLYRENRASCTVYDSRLINSQTPHKMLRRAFLVERGITYPEGRRRLEDQVFITEAYFAARRSAILADYVCYRYLRRPDRQNAGSQSSDPRAYLDNLGEVLDVVDAHTEPGPVRDQFYRRFLRVEMLGKLSGRRIVNTPLERGDRWLVPLRELAEERFPTSVDDGLPVLARLRSHLMRNGTFADLKQLSERTRRVQPEVVLTSYTRVGDSVMLKLDGGFVVDGSDLELLSDGDGGWLLPDAVVGQGTPESLRRVESVTEMAADPVVISRENHDEWFVHRPLSVTIEPSLSGARIRIHGEVRLDPATAAGGRSLVPGRHDLSVRVDALGLGRLRPLSVTPADSGCARVVAVLSSTPPTLLRTASNGRLSVHVGVPGKTIRKSIAPVRVRWTDRRVVVELAAGWLASRAVRAELLPSRGPSVTLQLSSTEDGSGRRWISKRNAVGPGRHRVRLDLPGAGAIDAEPDLQVPTAVSRIARSMGRRLGGVFRGVRWARRVADPTPQADKRA